MSRKASLPAQSLIGVCLDPVEFIIEQKVMRGIKQRAETAEWDRSKKSFTEAP
jgi:hypothetical protein